MEPSDFWALVDGADGTVRPGACWLWAGGDDGRLIWDDGRDYCWRVAWRLSGGESLGVGRMLVRTCRVELCCNPAHMVLRRRGGVGLASGEGGVVLPVPDDAVVAEMWREQFPVADIAGAVGCSSDLVLLAVRRMDLRGR